MEFEIKLEKRILRGCKKNIYVYFYSKSKKEIKRNICCLQISS